MLCLAALRNAVKWRDLGNIPLEQAKSPQIKAIISHQWNIQFIHYRGTPCIYFCTKLLKALSRKGLMATRYLHELIPRRDTDVPYLRNNSLICVLLEQFITDTFVLRIWKKRTPEAVWISLLCVVLWRDELKHNLRIIFLFLQVLHRLLNHVMTCHKLYLCECTHSQNRQLRCATNPSLNTVNHVPYGKNNFGLELTKNSPKKPPPCCLCFITKCVCRHSLWDVSKDTCKPPGRIPRAAVHLCTDCGSGATGK